MNTNIDPIHLLGIVVGIGFMVPLVETVIKDSEKMMIIKLIMHITLAGISIKLIMIVMKMSAQAFYMY